MALPFSFSSVLIAPQNLFQGPWKETGQYALLQDFTNQRILEMWKSSDADPETWTEQDTADKPSLTNIARALWGHQLGNSIHIGYQEVSTGRVGYSRFDTASHGTPDNWGIIDEAVETPADSSATAELSCSIAARSDGTVVVLYNGDEDSVMGSPYARVDYNIRSSGGTWGGPVTVVADEKAAVDWFGSVIVLGASDKSHFFFRDETNTDVVHRSLTSAGSLSSLENVDTAVAGNVNHCVTPGIYFDDGGTERIRALYYDSGSTGLSLVKVDNDGTPTTVVGVLDNINSVANGTPTACSAVDGTAMHVLYSDNSTLDLFHDQAATPQNAGDWGTDVEREDAVTINRISCNIYTRAGSKVLAWVEDNGGTIRYNELTLAAPTPDSYPAWFRKPQLAVYRY